MLHENTPISKIEKAELLHMLQQHHIPIDSWGTGEAKTVDHLVNEINDGETVLVEDKESGRLIRKFAFLSIVVLCHTDRETYKLIEEKQVFSDGRTRVRVPDWSVGEKIKPGEENIEAITKRALYEELGIQDNFGIHEGEHVEEEVDSKSYPGLVSRRNRFNVMVEIDPAQYRPEGYTEVQSDKTTYFTWRRVE
jgi:hypothetical protein